MILHLLRMCRNVNQNFFNDRKNVSATALRVTSPTTISRRFHTVAAIAAIQQRRCRAGLLDDDYREDEAAEYDAAGLPREDPPRASIYVAPQDLLQQVCVRQDNAQPLPGRNVSPGGRRFHAGHLGHLP